MIEYELYEETSSEKRKIATFYCECDMLSYIISLNLSINDNYFIIERDTTERKISVVSFKGICDWKKNKCK